MKYILAFALLLVVLPAFAQVPDIGWDKYLGGTNEDGGRCIIKTNDGGYVVCGYAYSKNGDITINKGESDIWVVKIDCYSHIEWQKTFGGNNKEEGLAIRQTKDGGYIVCGSTSSANNGDISGFYGLYDYWILKLSSTGDLQWQKCLGGTDEDRATNIEITSDGGYIVCGYSFSLNGEVTGHHGTFYAADAWVVKLDSTGNIIWQKSLGGTSGELANAVKQTADGGYIVACSAMSVDGDIHINRGFDDYWIVKLNSSGSIEWEKTYGGSSYDVPYDVEIANDGGYIISGASSSTNGDVTGSHGGYDYWILKINKSGAIEWKKNYGGSGNDLAYNIAKSSSGGYVITGEANSGDGDVHDYRGGGDCWTMHVDDSGNIVWAETEGGGHTERAYNIVETENESYVICGFSNSVSGDIHDLPKGNGDIWLIDYVPYGKPPLVSISSNKNSPVCLGSIVTFTANASNTTGIITYQWFRNGELVSNTSSPIFTDTIIKNNTYYDCIIKNNCMQGYSNRLAFQTIQLPPSPIITASGKTSDLCMKDSVILTSSTAPVYLWNTGQSTQSITVRSTGAYFVTITNVKGCNSTSDTTNVVFQNCTNPIGLYVNNISKNFVKLNWAQDSCAVGYQAEWRAKGTTAWNKSRTNSNHIIITSLSPNTTYQWRVIKVCRIKPDTLTSGYTIGQEFTTLSFTASRSPFTENINSRSTVNGQQSTILPNPTTGNTTLILLNKDEKVKIKVMDADGKVVWQKVTSESNIIIPSQRFAGSVYTVQVIGEKEVEYIKFVKQ